MTVRLNMPYKKIYISLSFKSERVLEQWKFRLWANIWSFLQEEENPQNKKKNEDDSDDNASSGSSWESLILTGFSSQVHSGRLVQESPNLGWEQIIWRHKKQISLKHLAARDPHAGVVPLQQLPHHRERVRLHLAIYPHQPPHCIRILGDSFNMIHSIGWLWYRLCWDWVTFHHW